MGQYHTLYNIDKKEVVYADEINNGLKLMEQCGWEKSTAISLWLMLANSNGHGCGDAKPHKMVGRWAGDRTVVQGDYAKEGDPAYLSESDREGFTNISPLVMEMLNAEFDND